MIELRWLLKSVKRLHGIDDGMMQPPLPDFITVPVLQYRAHPKGCLPPNVETLWIDVPTVSEPASGAIQGKPDAA